MYSAEKYYANGVTMRIQNRMYNGIYDYLFGLSDEQIDIIIDYLKHKTSKMYKPTDKRYKQKTYHINKLILMKFEDVKQYKDQEKRHEKDMLIPVKDIRKSSKAVDKLQNEAVI